MAEHFPEYIDPLALAEKRRQFKGTLPFSQMTRLQDLLTNLEGEARFDLRFEKEGRIATVKGTVEAVLELRCQCCLEPMAWPVSSQVNLGVVRTIDEANLLSEHYEPLLLEEDPLLLADIIQEELLLALPPIPQHSCCESAAPKGREKEEPEAPKRENPFAVLTELKNLHQ